MDNKPSFSRREWLLVISIILMIEAWILNISYSFKADQDVINYISFASTIASLLLAVLAIIYGFYQADGQHKLASTINFQLDSMREVQTSLNRAAEGLDGQLTQIASTTSVLGSISDSIESTHKKLGALEGGLTSLQSQQATFHAALRLDKVNAPETDGSTSVSSHNFLVEKNVPKEDSISRTTAFRKVIMGTSYPQDLVGYALNRAVNLKGVNSVPYYGFINDFAGQMGKEKILDLDYTRWFDLIGAVMGMLEAIEVISTFNPSESYKGRIFNMRPDSVEQLALISRQVAKVKKTAAGAALIDLMEWKTA